MPAASPWPAFPRASTNTSKWSSTAAPWESSPPWSWTPPKPELIVAATKYPPHGNRSIGGGMHALNYGTSAEEYYKKANDEILVIIQTEHIKAVEIADEIYAVPGLDAVFVGPNDLT